MNQGPTTLSNQDNIGSKESESINNTSGKDEDLSNEEFKIVDTKPKSLASKILSIHDIPEEDSKNIFESLAINLKVYEETIFNPEGSISQEPDPFSLKKVKDGYIIYLPQNFSEITCIPFRVGMSKILSSTTFALAYTKKTLTTKTNGEIENFFIGLFRTLDRTPESDEKASFSNGDALAKGASQAKLTMMKALFDREFSKVQQFLPDEIYFGEARLEYINFYLSEMIVDNNMITLRIARENISKLILRYVKKTKLFKQWDMLTSYKVPMSKVLEGLYSYKEKVIKGKKKSSPIKPREPSKRIEVIYSSERQFMEYHEICFVDFHKLTKKHKDGVPLLSCEDVRLEASSLTKQKWEVVKKFSAPLSYRSKVLLRIAKELKLKQGITRQTIAQIVEEIAKGEISLSHEDKLSLSSLYVASSTQEGKRIENALKDILLNRRLSNAVKLLISTSNPDTYINILDENLGVLYKSDEVPLYKRHLPSYKEEEVINNNNINIESNFDGDVSD